MSGNKSTTTLRLAEEDGVDGGPGGGGARSGSGDMARIEEEQARWLKETYGPEVERRGERMPFVFDCGVEAAPLYTPADIAGKVDYLRDIGFPGEFPYTRGAEPGMGRVEPFVVSAYSGFGDAEACNKRFHYLVKHGAEQILVANDLPTQCGYDSDHEMAAAEVGQVGVAIDTLADMEVLFDGIPVDSVKRVGTLCNSLGPVALALYAALGEKQGVDWSRYTVNLQNDPLKEYIARGTQILPPEPAAKLAVDAVEWCADHAPHWSPMTVCVNHINAGGAGSLKGSAIALANVVHYVELLLARGRSIDEIAPLLHMFPDERHDFFVTIANLRALRRVWARLMKGRYGATNPDAMRLRTTVYGHGQESLQEPLNNIARTAFGTLAYALGGASYVYIASYDEAVSTPGEESLLVALRTQQIIAHEHGFSNTIDPLGGSYFVEHLTDEIEQGILQTLAELEDAGGALRVIKDGLGRRIMTDGAVRRQRAFDSGERPWITVNKWRQEPHVPNTAFRVDPESEKRQLARLARVKQTRDGKRVAAALAEVDRACAEDRNVMPSVLEAVRANATIGEICEVWRQRFGSFEPNTDF